MKDFGKTRSTVKPDAVVIDEHSVWVHTDIQEVHESMGENQSFDGYEFNMTQYEKDEYILMMSEKNVSQTHSLHFVKCMKCLDKEGVNQYGTDLCRPYQERLEDN